MKASKSKIKELSQQILEASDKYYNDSAIITDKEFDALVEELKSLDPNNKALKAVGAKTTSAWVKQKHKQPMGSLLKITTQEELTAWANKYTSGNELFWTEKMDGLSIGLEYSGGKLVKAITRGDGTEGEDITRNVLLMKVPTKIPVKSEILVRAEMILPISAWKKYFTEYSNPRNSVSGTSRRHNGVGCEHIEVYAFSAIGTKNETQSLNIKDLRSWGFLTPKNGTSSPKEIMKVLKKAEEGRSELPYEIDGIVLSENNISAFQEQGEVDGRPRAARAFKFESAEAVTTLKEVLWQVGRTGVITPVGLVNDVQVAGVTISRVTLHNVEEIRRLGIGIGSKVLIKRAGDVIPKIVSTVSKGEDIIVPHECPSCGSQTSRDELRVFCTAGSDCPAQNQQVFLHYLDKLGVLGVGEALIQKLMEAGKLSELPDLYKLKVSDISDLERLGEKVAVKVLKEIKDKSQGITMAEFLSAVGIPGLSNKTLAKVFSKHKNIESVKKLTAEQLMEIDSVGEIVAGNIVSGLKKNSKVIDELLCFVGIEEEKSKSGPLLGVIFCFTGFRDANLSEKAKALGGEESDSLTKAVTHLVAKDPNSSSGKIEKAKKSGVKILGIKEFEELLSTK